MTTYTVQAETDLGPTTDTIEADSEDDARDIITAHYPAGIEITSVDPA